MIADADCLGFNKESKYSDLGFDKESYRGIFRILTSFDYRKLSLFAISKKVPFFIKSALSVQY